MPLSTSVHLPFVFSLTTTCTCHVRFRRLDGHGASLRMVIYSGAHSRLLRAVTPTLPALDAQLRCHQSVLRYGH
jgi:hypothetical protein